MRVYDILFITADFIYGSALKYVPKINLQNPLQARRWLNLLQADSRCGFRLRPNLDVKADKLGFSLRSNQLGLRGPCDMRAGKIVFGTSYAMGIAVNNGENWHEQCLCGDGWLNLGLAVGIREWSELLAMHHDGPKELAVLLYHPNIWTHCLMYESWRASKLDVFKALRWKTDWTGCAWILLRKNLLGRLLNRKRWLKVSLESGPACEVDTSYSRVPDEKMPGVFDRNITKLISLLAPFQRVAVVRLRTKQELVPSAFVTPALGGLLSQYDLLWEKTLTCLSSVRTIEVHVPKIFSMRHFHTHDTHWNADGNRVFSDWMLKSIVRV